MKKAVRRVRTVVFSVMLVGLTATLAQAQATRTWVSGVGNDANPCSLTAPCKTFAGAISKTAAGGEIDALDPGGYGAVTIAKSISINGAGTTLGTNGINVIAAAQVHVENCLIANFSTSAITFHPASGSLFVTNTTILNNQNGGISISTGRAMIENLHASGNGNGVAVSVVGNAIATVRNSYVAGNSTGFAAIVNPAAVLNIENCVVTHNFNGITVNSGATARVSNTTVVSNTSAGLVNDGISFLVSLSGNIVIGNPTNGSFTSTVLKQ